MNSRTSDGQTTCRPTLGACSFVYQLPDVVLQRNRKRAMPYAETFNGIILFADVSGFTEMCQKYSSDVRRGVNQLANALNSYMAPIVEAILREKGDVYKFAGDAVLGLFDGKERNASIGMSSSQDFGPLKSTRSNTNTNRRNAPFPARCT